jgi:hypothetical protein
MASCSWARRSPGPGREGLPARFECWHGSRRACRQQRRLRRLPWQASGVPHRGRPGRQRRGIREELAAAAAGPGARNGVSHFFRATVDIPGWPGSWRRQPRVRHRRSPVRAGPPAPHPAYVRSRSQSHTPAPPRIALVCIPWWPPPRPVSSAWRTGFPSSLRISGCDRLQLEMYSLPVPAPQRAVRDQPVHPPPAERVPHRGPSGMAGGAAPGCYSSSTTSRRRTGAC